MYTYMQVWDHFPIQWKSGLRLLDPTVYILHISNESLTATNVHNKQDIANI